MSSEAFNERETRLMAFAWQCFEEQPKIDYEKLAALAGMTNPRSAANAWAIIKKKLIQQGTATANDGDTAGPSPKATPKATPSKRGKKAASEADGESPTKKLKRANAKAAKATRKDAEDEDDNGEEEATGVKQEDMEI